MFTSTEFMPLNLLSFISAPRVANSKEVPGCRRVRYLQEMEQAPTLGSTFILSQWF